MLNSLSFIISTKLRCLWMLLPAFFLLAGTISAGSAETPTRTTLPNGLMLIVCPNHLTDLVAVEVMLNISALDEPGDQVGIRHLLRQLSQRGSRLKRGELEAWGGEVGAEVGLDYVEYNALVVSGGFGAAIKTLADMIQLPDFAGADVERLKTDQTDYLESLHKDPFQSAYLLLRKQLYGDFPYGETTAGEQTSISNITLDGLKAFHARWYVPNNTTIVVSGNVEPAQAQQIIERYFGKWEKQSLPERKYASPAPPEDSNVAVEEGEVDNAHMMIGFPAPAAGANQEFAAFQIISALLGRGMSGRLITSLRNKSRIAYDISCFNPTLKQESHLVVYVVCDAGRLEEAKNIIVQEINKILQEPVGKEELEATKKYAAGQYLLSRQRNRQRAYFLAWYQTLGLGFAFEQTYPTLINQVTPEALQDVARKYLSKMAISVILPQ
jgi:zinc protease